MSRQWLCAGLGVAVLVGGAASANSTNSSGPVVGYYSWKYETRLTTNRSILHISLPLLSAHKVLTRSPL